jgi:hypothetical protein
MYSPMGRLKSKATARHHSVSEKAAFKIQTK